ncbi:DUF2490 domain-containing protein [Aequorivita echinoideorum]|uniref:DUF2490 domain-containing protein n=1 Tax=Aequorivita echinoideorum TaxID=1549647 RepID=A0ABS5S2M8_9FLAO|nr:DUF2490 domain-containing protein [Aequorivita echinoideorum]MBT0607462.1 DUF2490 domain-containing protein [Aequorivita echinoideorum]
MFPILTFSQESNLGAWYAYTGSKKIDSLFNWHHEVQFRNYNAVGDLEQLLLRTGIGYNLSENNNNVLLGYAYILSQNYVDVTDEKVDVNEHRIFQQFITKQNFNFLSLQHRYRFEQRFIESDFRLRFRYFLSVNIPLGISIASEKPLYATAYNEIFLNTEETIFDRNRLYGAFGYRFNEAFRVELGYMNQFLQNGSRDQIMVMTFLNF